LQGAIADMQQVARIFQQMGEQEAAKNALEQIKYWQAGK
jgi:hypothetical protein